MIVASTRMMSEAATNPMGAFPEIPNTTPAIWICGGSAAKEKSIIDTGCTIVHGLSAALM